MIVVMVQCRLGGLSYTADDDYSIEIKEKYPHTLEGVGDQPKQQSRDTIYRSALSVSWHLCIWSWL